LLSANYSAEKNEKRKKAGRVRGTVRLYWPAGHWKGNPSWDVKNLHPQGAEKKGRKTANQGQLESFDQVVKSCGERTWPDGNPQSHKNERLKKRLLGFCAGREKKNSRPKPATTKRKKKGPKQAPAR